MHLHVQELLLYQKADDVIPVNDTFKIYWLRFYMPGELKKLTRVMIWGIKSVLLIFKTTMLIYQSKTNLDEKILSGNNTRL